MSRRAKHPGVVGCPWGGDLPAPHPYQRGTPSGPAVHWEQVMRNTLQWVRTMIRLGLQVVVFACMCLALQRGSPVQAAAEARGTSAQTQPVAYMANTLVPVIVDGTASNMPVMANLPLDQRHAESTRAVIVMHGALRNAEASFTAIQRAATSAGDAARHTLILAPQFLSEVDEVRYAIPLDVPVWSVDGWKDGDLS